MAKKFWLDILKIRTLKLKAFKPTYISTANFGLKTQAPLLYRLFLLPFLQLFIFDFFNKF